MNDAGQVGPTESALLVLVPPADGAVATHRERYDPSARVGVPAHVTIAYPFRPVEDLTDEDLAVLRRIVAGQDPVEVSLESLSWFDEDVLVLEPADPEPLLGVIAGVGAAFPDHPIYGGAHARVRPHVTVAHGGDPLILRRVAQDVEAALPIRHRATAVELWAGPALRSGRGTWRPVMAFPFAGE